MADFTLNLYDIIKKAGIPLDDVVIIRHSIRDKFAKKIYELDKKEGNDLLYFQEYQKLQKSEKYFKGKKYILSFVSDEGTLARFIGCYTCEGVITKGNFTKMEGFPCPEMYDSDGYYFNLQLNDYMSDLRKRLVIDWGKGTIGYVQYSKEALMKKEVVAIAPDKNHVFPGYDKVLWKFNEMKEFVTKQSEYVEITSALKEVNAVYLITDPVDGKFYIGSASGKDGLLERWKSYAMTLGTGGNTKGEGGNVLLSKHLAGHKDRYIELQYSILKIVHKTGDVERDRLNTLEVESDFKRKLCTRGTPWGLNDN